MKRIATGLVSLLAVVTLVVGASVVMAAKPLPVIEHSNGFPSGQHFNLNIHGKKDGFSTTSTGNSIFIPIYSSDYSVNSTIQYLSNKKNRSSLNLTVLDPLTEPFDGDAAQVYLPYNIFNESENKIEAAGGYWVFGRILGKPNNGKPNNGSSSNSTIRLYPNIVVASANATDNATDNWPFDPDDDLLELGLITNQMNVYQATPDGFVQFDRFENEKGNKRGKSKAIEITDLFKWTGIVADNATVPDLNNSGDLDSGDVPAWWEEQYGDNSTTVEEWEFFDWLDWLVAEDLAVEYVNEWIFNIADMVVSGQRLSPAQFRRQ